MAVPVVSDLTSTGTGRTSPVVVASAVSAPVLTNTGLGLTFVPPLGVAQPVFVQPFYNRQKMLTDLASGFLLLCWRCYEIGQQE